MESFNLSQLLSNVGSADSIPTGEHVIEARKCELETSKKGQLMLHITAFIVGGPFAGRVIHDRIVLIPDNGEALQFFYHKLACWGAADKALLEQCVGTLEPIAKVIPGRRARVKLVEHNYNGRIRPQVGEYLAPVAGDSVPDPTAGVGSSDDADETPEF